MEISRGANSACSRNLGRLHGTEYSYLLILFILLIWMIGGVGGTMTCSAMANLDDFFLDHVSRNLIIALDLPPIPSRISL